MKILHTSDWHLGQMLHRQKRSQEMNAFIEWLIALIEREGIEAVLIAGDVYDTTTPGSAVQKVYNDFLAAMVRLHVPVVVTAGNHDSPTLLDASKELCANLDLRIVGATPDDPAQEVFAVPSGESPRMIVAAVPFLHVRDLGTLPANLSAEELAAARTDAIAAHYQAVMQEALALRERTDPSLPIVLMGHLMMAGSRTSSDLPRIGGLQMFSAARLPDGFDYMALGHIHRAQSVGGRNDVRYSGSPLAMDFGERAAKLVYIVDVTPGNATVRPVEIPCTQELLELTAPLDDLVAQIARLAETGSTAWIFATCVCTVETPDECKRRLEAAFDGTSMMLLGFHRQVPNATPLTLVQANAKAEELTPESAFELRLASKQIPEAEAAELRALYSEILQSQALRDGSVQP